MGKPVKHSVSCYKKNSTIESIFHNRIKDLYKEYPSAFLNLKHEDKVTWFTKTIYHISRTNVYANQAPEIKANYAFSIHENDRASTTATDVSTMYCLSHAIAKAYNFCKADEDKLRGDLVSLARAVAYYHCMKQIDMIPDVMKSDSSRFKYLCALQQLRFFNIEQPHDYSSVINKYVSAKEHKNWYETAWLPKFFWFCYQKPNLQDFYKLQMQYRYVKNAQRLGIFKNAY